ncbi:MAG: DUF3108 domain-containing protein [Gammaproteobacteria bacterium]
MHHPVLRTLVAAVLLTVALPLPALESFRADYDISRGALTLGRMSRELVIDAAQGRYRFASTMETKGLVALFADARVVETSAGRFGPAGFAPESYTYDKKGKKKDYALEFDYARNLVRRDDDAGWESSMPARLLDKLSYQAQLMVDLDARPARLRYDIADKNRLKEYLIENLGAERVETRLGEFDTVRLMRADDDSQRRTIVWCAPELGWMAVKVEHRDKKGDVTTAVLRSLERN